MFENLIISLLILPLIGVLLLIIIPANKRNALKIVALNFSSLPFFGFLIIWAFFKKSIAQFQFLPSFPAASLMISRSSSGKSRDGWSSEEAYFPFLPESSPSLS